MPLARSPPQPMTDALTIDQSFGPPAATKVRVPATAQGKEIRGPLKVALDLLIYGSLDENGKISRYTWQQAGSKANYSLVSMRKALERPHVLRYLREQRQVFRAHAAAGNILRAVEIRDQDDNRTAAIQAIRYLDGIGDETVQREGQRAVSPGVVVQVTVNQGPRHVDETLIEVGTGPVPDTQSGEDG